MNIAAGEYGYDSGYFRRMLEAQAVDVLQADATRCAGITGFLEAGALCRAFQLPFSFHCAPALHAAPACAVPSYWIGEYFFDHARIEQMLFDGALKPVDGALKPESVPDRDLVWNSNAKTPPVLPNDVPAMKLKQMIRGLAEMRRKPAKVVRPADDLGSRWDNFLERTLPSPLGKELVDVDVHVREGRFQRGLSLMAGASSILAGLEVSYEHYKGSYGQKVMWTPVALSGAMTGAGIWGFFNTWAARVVLRWTSVVTLLDSLIGFFFHVRGIARKPGGWRLPVTNIVMGPPIFAPLLFGVSAYLGLIASFLRPEEAPEIFDLTPSRWRGIRRFFFGRQTPWTQELREGRFQKHLAVATILSAFFSGFEALYSHYKNNFKYKAQWSPVIIAPLLMLAAAWSIRSPRAARTVLPVMSIAAIVDGGVGFYYHARGVWRRPGGTKQLVYNILYGPPIFAPLLFAACGVLGLLACLMRRERRLTR